VDLVMLCEERLERTPDGVIWGLSSYDVWSRYLDVFDSVRLVGRVREVPRPTGQNLRASGPGVTVWSVPHYHGPREFLKMVTRIGDAVRRSYQVGDAVIVRVGGQIGQPLYKVLRRIGAPYGVEVIGDPYEAFAPGSMTHPLRPLFRWWFTIQQQRFCRNAVAAAYVTERALQRRYPCGGREFGVAEVLLTGYPGSNGRPALKTEPGPDGPCRLITIGSLEHRHKGTDVLLEAVARCGHEGLALTLTIVGDGRCRRALEDLAGELQIATRVRFVGAVAGAEAVRQLLGESDLFVLPSRTEGLPRVLLEAMAMGLPCIASNVGGIPELLPPEDMFPAGQVGDLVAKIADVIVDRNRLNRMSARNTLKSGQFLDPALRERRNQFYRHLRGQTEDWLHGDGVEPSVRLTASTAGRAEAEPGIRH
jgi:glycosyltransferase involved in cell wall biosynthesis